MGIYFFVHFFKDNVNRSYISFTYMFFFFIYLCLYCYIFYRAFTSFILCSCFRSILVFLFSYTAFHVFCDFVLKMKNFRRQITFLLLISFSAFLSIHPPSLHAYFFILTHSSVLYIIQFHVLIIPFFIFSLLFLPCFIYSLFPSFPFHLIYFFPFIHSFVLSVLLLPSIHHPHFSVLTFLCICLFTPFIYSL